MLPSAAIIPKSNGLAAAAPFSSRRLLQQQLPFQLRSSSPATAPPSASSTLYRCLLLRFGHPAPDAFGKPYPCPSPMNLGVL
ncbi:hypothetical protein MLD38_038007 [Melastoma candidum]|uniref:Uncharacterized protein n=1 Tax=Melastoma candidum TaxID=119954 RepID=A0ACB9KXN4_9MYRT|nr:hypothetical protein MLD38_038007 [Melastoma candidum]